MFFFGIVAAGFYSYAPVLWYGYFQFLADGDSSLVDEVANGSEVVAQLIAGADHFHLFQNLVCGQTEKVFVGKRQLQFGMLFHNAAHGSCQRNAVDDTCQSFGISYATGYFLFDVFYLFGVQVVEMLLHYAPDRQHFKQYITKPCLFVPFQIFKFNGFLICPFAFCFVRHIAQDDTVGE